MSRRTILGWFTEDRLWPGRDGIPIRESGTEGRTSRSEWASESVGSEALDGAGVIGDSIGTTTTRCITTRGITRRAGHFTTAAVSTVERVPAGDITDPEDQIGRSRETIGRPVDTLSHMAKAAPVRERSAATTMADRPGTILRGAKRAWAVEEREAEERPTAVAGAGARK